MTYINLLIFFICCTQILSQQIYFSKGYSQEGEPIDPFTNNKVQINQTIYILLDNGKKIFNQNLIFLYIDKQEGNKDLNRFTKILQPDKKKNWLVHIYKFTDEGIYNIYFSDFNRNRIASAQITITAPEKRNSYRPFTQDHFPNLKVIICNQVIDGKPNGFLESISMKTQGGQTYIYLLNDRELNTEKIAINIFRKKNTGSDFDEFVDSKKYKINSRWYDTFFKYTFKTPGEYKINFFNEKELLIKTTYITVEK